jgi:hypothetical protein
MATNLDYESVWNTIKATGHASITTSKFAAKRVTTGILKAKAKENVMRRNSGLMFWSKLTITRTMLNENMMRVDFNLLYETKL